MAYPALCTGPHLGTEVAAPYSKHAGNDDPSGADQHRDKGFSWRASCGIMCTLHSGEVFPGRTLATPCDGAAMIGSSNDSGRYGKLDGSTKENLVAEGIAMAVAVAILATVAFFLFRA